MSDIDLQTAAGLAAEWACEAGETACNRQSKGFTTGRKSDRSLVTEVDLALQQRIIDHIVRAYPQHGVIGEETIFDDRVAWPSASRYTWVIDPLDGTRNYAHGFPFFSVAIALLHDGCPVVGVVRDPIRRQTYSAVRGQGALLEGRTLAVSDTLWGDQTLLAFGTPKNQPLPKPLIARWMQHLVLRNCGSTCLNLAFTAAGFLDACHVQEAGLWDVAAGALLVTEAGGKISNMQGGEVFPVHLREPAASGNDFAMLAAGPRLHQALVDSLRQET